MKKAEPVTVLSFTGFLMFLLAALYYFYEYWLRVAPGVMSTELKAHFNISDPVLGHLAACYYYAYVAMQIPVGIMFDRYGVRKILSAACGVCVLGTLIFCRTDSFLWAQLGRFLMGLGSAFAYVGVLKITNLWFPQKYFGLAAGVCTALGMVGADSGLRVLGHLVHTISWQETLNIVSYVGIGLTLLLFLSLKDKPPLEVAQTLSLKRGLPSGLLGSFVEIASSRKIWLSGVIGSLSYLPISAFAELWAVPYLEVAGYTRAEAAASSGLLFWGFAIGGPVWGLISATLNSRRLPLMLGSLVAAVFSLLIVTVPQMSPVWMKALLLLCGVFASAQVLVFAVSNDLCDSQSSGTAVAFTNMLVMLGGALLQPVIGFLLHIIGVSTGDWGGASHALHRVQSYETALLVLPVSLLVSAVLSFSIHEPESVSKSIGKKLKKVKQLLPAWLRLLSRLRRAV